MNKGIYIRQITVTDPDTGGDVIVEIYKDPETGGIFGLDSSYIEDSSGEVINPFTATGDGIYLE